MVEEKKEKELEEDVEEDKGCALNGIVLQHMLLWSLRAIECHFFFFFFFYERMCTHFMECSVFKTVS